MLLKKHVYIFVCMHDCVCVCGCVSVCVGMERLFSVNCFERNACPVGQSCLTLCDTMDHQAALSIGFSRQEYWCGLPFPSSGDLPNPRFESGSSALQADSLLSEPPGKLI